MNNNDTHLNKKQPFLEERNFINPLYRWVMAVFLIAAVSVSCSDNPGSTDPEAARLVVETVTTGGDPNPAGYTVLVQGAGSNEAQANGSVQFNNLEPGTRQVELTGIAGHCTITGENSVSVEMIAGETVTVVFEITCTTILRNQIVFLSNQDSGFGIYKMNPDGSDAARVAEFNVSGIWRPAISPDGLKIAFVSTATGFNTQQVWVVDADGTNWANLTQDNTRHSEHPTWSPDGSQIAFHAYDAPNGEGDIYIMNADGSGKRNVTNSETGDWWPSWSPDGETLAFHSIEPGSPVYISTIKTDGSGRTELLRDSAVFYRNPSWSPDGSQIAFQSNLESGVSWEIVVANADGSNQRSVTNLADANIQHRFPAWSPDGSQIAFDSNRDGSGVYDIFVVNTDGSGLTNITNNTGSTTIFPSWSPVE